MIREFLNLPVETWEKTCKEFDWNCMSSYFQFEYVNNRFSAKVFFQFFLPSCLTVNLTLRSADYSTVYAYRENSIHIIIISVPEKSSLHLMTSSVLRVRAKHEQSTVELCDAFSSPIVWIRKGISLLAGTTYGMNITNSTASNLRVKVTLYRPVYKIEVQNHLFLKF